MLAHPEATSEKGAAKRASAVVNSMCNQNEAQGTCHERKNLAPQWAFIGPLRLPDYPRVS